MRKVALALTALLAVAGCGKVPQPRHLTVICVVAEVDGDLPFERERRAAAEDWWPAAMHEPGSTFEVVAVGKGRDSVRRRFVAQIPRRWGAGVLTMKAAFWREVSQRAGAARLEGDSASYPEGARSAGLEPGDPQRVLVLEPGAAGEVKRTVIEVGSVPSPVHTSVVCDLSDSGLDQTCTAAPLDAVYSAWMPGAAANAGTSFTVYVAGTTRDETRRVFRAVAPEGALGARVAHLIGARREVGAALAASDNPRGSALFEAISVAAENLMERNGQRTLVLLSDLRAVSKARFSFEREVPPEEDVLRWLAQDSLLPNLQGVEVVAGGVHSLRGPSAPPFDARSAERLKAVWVAALRAMGAEPRLYSDVSTAIASLGASPAVKREGEAK